MTSDPDVYDFSNGQPAEKLETECEAENRPPRGVIPHLVKVVGRDHDHEDAHPHRQRTQDDPRQAAGRGEGLDVPKDAEAIADETPRVLENLGQVAARGALEHD